MLVGLAAAGLCMVGAEQEDVGRRREEQRVLMRQRRGGARRQPLVRGADTAADRQVARDRPDDEQEKENEQRDADPAPPALPPFRPHRARPGIARGGAVGLRPRRRAAGPLLERNLALRAATAVNAVRLVSAGHPAGYVTRAGCPPIVSSGSTSAGRRSWPASSTRTATSS